MIYEYYYEMMEDIERNIYRSMYQGFINHQVIIEIRDYDEDRIYDIFEFITYDHPEIYYIKTIEFIISLNGYWIEPIYRFSEKRINIINDAIEREVSKILAKCYRHTAIAKEQIIHDYLVNKVTYKDLDAPYSHEMAGVFLFGIGVCEGISKAFKYLCDRLNIKSGFVIGRLDNKPDEYHAWNVIYIESVWYNIDVTFDLNLSIHDYRYDYFNLCDIELNDRKSLFNVHKCNKCFDYYKRINRYAGNSRELVNIIKNNNDQIITIQLPIIKEDREKIIEYLMKIVFKNSKKDRKIDVRINPNFDRGVYTIVID